MRIVVPDTPISVDMQIARAEFIESKIIFKRADELNPEVNAARALVSVAGLGEIYDNGCEY